MSEKPTQRKRKNAGKPAPAVHGGRKQLPNTAKARQAAMGDIVPARTPQAIEDYVANAATEAASGAKRTALRDILARAGSEKRNGTNNPVAAGTALRTILEGASPDDAAAIRRMLEADEEALLKPTLNPDEELSEDWRNGGYPYKNLMLRKNYEKVKYKLQVELLKLQAWVKETGARVVILFEGRDAAGKGGTIKRFMEHLNPRGARVVALEKPSDIERGQWYFQRYVNELPTAGEIVLFDRSWYNRAGVEHVMGFCTKKDYGEFMRQAPQF